MKPPRILFAGLFHETHTFLPEPTRWADFAVTTGADILAKEGDESPTAGFLEEARRFGWEVVPVIDARAMPSGPVEDAAFESYLDQTLAEIGTGERLIFGVSDMVPPDADMERLERIKERVSSFGPVRPRSL